MCASSRRTVRRTSPAPRSRSTAASRAAFCETDLVADGRPPGGSTPARRRDGSLRRPVRPVHLAAGRAARARSARQREGREAQHRRRGHLLRRRRRAQGERARRALPQPPGRVDTRAGRGVQPHRRGRGAAPRRAARDATQPAVRDRSRAEGARFAGADRARGRACRADAARISRAGEAASRRPDRLDRRQAGDGARRPDADPPQAQARRDDRASACGGAAECGT